MSKIPRGYIERAARIYASNQFASDALGIHVATFGRLCKRYGIETPYERRRKGSPRPQITGLALSKAK